MLGDLVTVGASGSIFGLLGALFAYFLRNRALAQSGPQLLLISSLLAFNIVLGLDEGGMVDNSGHLAGFAAGVWLGWSTCPQWKVRLLLCVLQGQSRRGCLHRQGNAEAHQSHQSVVCMHG